ncbi:hydroxyethylthiazole kinase [Thermogymnomonas acidicola]|uniref:NAD(P)H-hydrate dehydratase n=1 Tax=Thermogymnomonas acidicola TaxID=399579 RepID=UPI0014941E0F|nr:NAD(P)H-hydrate dehydratase [Thermogymnomonas acidicola]
MEFAKSHGVVVVLKGEEDIITDGNSLYRCTGGGNPRMTMGGTGDMLAGLISALMSKGMPALRASLLGTFINKSAADMCMERKGLWYSVSDMIGAVPEVFLRYSDGAKINSFRAH